MDGNCAKAGVGFGKNEMYPCINDQVRTMVIKRLSVLVSGFSPVHTTLVVVSGYFGMFQDVSGSAVNGHGAHTS
jgi:hypothetical protein